VTGSPIASLTAEELAKNLEALDGLAMEALGIYRTVEEQYSDALLALTTLPRLSTRIKMAILPGRWPRVREGAFAADLRLLHRALALLATRLKMLKDLGGMEDSQTRGGNAREAARVLELHKGGSDGTS
jgi:hypothetical protein